LADVSLNTAEMAQMQQIAPVMPPLSSLCTAAAVVALSGNKDKSPNNLSK
jgi:hypothetical protein